MHNPQQTYWHYCFVKKIFFLLLYLFSFTVSASSDRIALVIGNSKYTELGSLANPINDAKSINKILQEMGYKTKLVLDATESTIRKDLRSFASESDNASIALVFFAGHGAQINGENYLLPVDIEIPKRESDIQLSALKVDDVINSIKSKTKVIFLDACRDNPALIKSLTKGRGSFRSGLAPTNAVSISDQSSGIFIAYATDASNIASDGPGQLNSPFTTALLKYIKQPVSIDDMFSMVTKEVRHATKNAQKPYKYASLDGVICLPGSCLNQADNRTLQKQISPFGGGATSSTPTLPDNWVMFNVANNPKSTIYVNPKSIQSYQSRVVADQKWVSEENGSYNVIKYVYECPTFKSNVASIVEYDSKGKQLKELFFGDFKIMDLPSDYSKDKFSIGFTSTMFLCNKDAHTPIVDSKEINSSKWVKFFPWSTNAEMYYLDGSYKKGDSGTIIIKVKFPRTVGSDIKKKFSIDTGVDNFKYVPYASYYVSKLRILCKEKKYYEEISNFFDDDLSLVGYLNINQIDPNLANKYDIDKTSAASQLSRLVCD